MVDHNLFSSLLSNFRQCKAKGTWAKLELETCNGEEQVSFTARAPDPPVRAARRPPTVVGHPPRQHAGFRRPAAGQPPNPTAGQTQAAGQPPTSAAGQTQAAGHPSTPASGHPQAAGLPTTTAVGQTQAAGQPPTPAAGQRQAAGFPPKPANDYPTVFRKKTPSTWRRDNQRFISWCYKRNPTPPHGLPRVQIPPSHPADPATPAVSDPLQAATPPQGLPRVQIPPPHQAAAASVSADMLQAATPEPQERPPPPSPPLLRPRKRSRCIEQVDGCLDDETSDEGTSDEETSDEETSEEETSEEETSKDKSPAASSSPAKEQQQLILVERLLAIAEKKIDKRFEEFMEEIRNSHV